MLFAAARQPGGELEQYVPSQTTAVTLHLAYPANGETPSLPNQSYFALAS